MNQQITPKQSSSAGTVLRCRLRPRHLRRGHSATAGEIEIENTSLSPVDIVVRSSLLQYVDLIVTGPDGQKISESFYGDMFSPLAEPYTVRLQAGEKYTGPVSLVGNVPAGKLRPGRYTVRAVYAYETIQAISDPLEFHLDEQDCR